MPPTITDAMLAPELDYLRRLVNRTTTDRSLREDLFDAAQFRLVHALSRVRVEQAWRSYVRCAMHSAVISELRRHRYRTDHELACDEPPAGEYPSVETLIVRCEERAESDVAVFHCEERKAS